MLKARADVVDAVEELKDINKESYLAIVDDVVRKYADSHAAATDIAVITKELRAAWPHIHAALKPAKKVARRAIKKVYSA